MITVTVAIQSEREKKKNEELCIKEKRYDNNNKKNDWYPLSMITHWMRVRMSIVDIQAAAATTQKNDEIFQFCFVRYDAAAAAAVAAVFVHMDIISNV